MTWTGSAAAGQIGNAIEAVPTARAAMEIQHDELVEATIKLLLHPTRLYSAREVLARASPVPKSPGVYAWYFDELPSALLDDGYHRWNGYNLLYVGVAPGRRTPPSRRTLRQRLRDHFAGNAEGSTLRKTLGCLLSDTLNIKLRRVGSGKRQTFTNPGERELDKWMAQHARVTWAVIENPWLAEEKVISRVPLPLNLQGNQHAFCGTLEKIRGSAAEVARSLDIIVDNGGPRSVVTRNIE